MDHTADTGLAGETTGQQEAEQVSSPSAGSAPADAPPPAPPRVQYLRCATQSGRVFELGKKWPPIHPAEKGRIAVRVGGIAIRLDDDPYWELRGMPEKDTPLAKATRVLICDVPLSLCSAEGTMHPDERVRVLADREKDYARQRKALGVEVLPGHSQKFRAIMAQGQRLFAIGQAWPMFWADPKREVYFKGRVDAIDAVYDNNRGLYYEIVGTPAPGTPAAEKKRLIVCELQRSLVDWVDASWVADDLAAIHIWREKAEQAALAEQAEEEAEDEGLAEGEKPEDLID